MLKSALFLFAVVIAVLVVLALQPDDRTALPDSDIELTNTRVTLYPEADAEAVWTFEAPQASYDPDRGESVLLDLQDGRRMVDGETDFTVSSDRLVIDRRDDIRGQVIFAYLVETGECLTMRGVPETPVTIDQSRGMFRMPVIEISGPTWGDGTRLENMDVSFDLEDFEAGGEGTSTTVVLRTGEDEEQRRTTICENS